MGISRSSNRSSTSLDASSVVNALKEQLLEIPGLDLLCEDLFLQWYLVTYCCCIYQILMRTSFFSFFFLDNFSENCLSAAI